MTAVFIIIGCIVLFLVIRFFQSASPKGFAKQLAKVQLHALKHQKQIHPEYPREKLYMEVIKTRPGYSEEMARDIIAYAKEHYSKGHDLDFQMVVVALAVNEFQARMKREPGLEELDKLCKGVMAAIPFEKLVFYGDVNITDVYPNLKDLNPQILREYFPKWDGKMKGRK